jgi:hypothetical protein
LDHHIRHRTGRRVSIETPRGAIDIRQSSHRVALKKRRLHDCAATMFLRPVRTSACPETARSGAENRKPTPAVAFWALLNPSGRALIGQSQIKESK